MGLNAALAVLHGMKPKDELETLLFVQMIGAHNLAMEFMSRATLPGQTQESVSANTDRAGKLLKVFTAQLDSINRYRSKGAAESNSGTCNSQCRWPSNRRDGQTSESTIVVGRGGANESGRTTSCMPEGMAKK